MIENNLDERRCQHCHKTLVRKERENGRDWKRRVVCDRVCSRKLPREHEAVGVSIEWEPIIADPPTEDRCWFGFKAGRRCVLPRGLHDVHQFERVS